MISFIRRMSAKLSLRLTLKFRSVLNYEKDPIQDLELLSQLLKEELFDNLDAKKHSFSIITSEHSTLDSLLKNLKEINLFLQHERNVNEKIKERYPKTTDIFRFFSNTEGFYIYNSKAIVSLKKELSYYVSFLKEHCKEEVGMNAHNYRSLKSTTVNLVQTSLTLIQISIK